MALVLALMVVTPRLVDAQSPYGDQLKAAESHFKQGRAFFEAGDFDRAIEEYEKANELVPHPVNLFNIGLAYRGKGDYKAALVRFKRYLDLAPKSSRANEASTYIAELTQAIAQAERKAAEEARIRARESFIASGEATRRADRQTRTIRWAGLGTAAAGVVTMSVGIYYGLDSRRRSSEIEERERDWTDEELATAFDDGESAETRSIIFSSVGAGLAVAGGVVWYLGHRRQKAMERRFLASPIVGPDGAGVQLQLSF